MSAVPADQPTLTDVLNRVDRLNESVTHFELTVSRRIDQLSDTQAARFDSLNTRIDGLHRHADLVGLHAFGHAARRRVGVAVVLPGLPRRQPDERGDYPADIATMIRVPKARAGFPGGKPAAGNPTRLEPAGGDADPNSP